MDTNFYSNHLVHRLNEQHRDRVDFLQSKIAEQQKEIEQLEEKIKLMSQEKDYEC